MIIYILRHGETEFNRLGIVQGSGVDTDLNETGQSQARAFFEAYRDVDFQLIVTSKLKRTHQTVQAFIDQHIPWIQTPDINEISWGEHEGLPVTPEHIEIYKRTITHWQSGNLEASMPGGESASQLLERVSRFVDWLKTRPEQRIVVATHGRTLRCLLTLLKGVGPGDMEGMPHANTGLYILRYEDDQFIFDRENDLQHLRPTLSEVETPV